LKVRKGPFLLICHGVTGWRWDAPKCAMTNVQTNTKLRPSLELPSSLRFDATSPQYRMAGQVGEAGDDDESSRKMHDRALWDGRWDG